MDADVLYYLDDFSDEVMPCEPSLEAWAAWLSSPQEEWGRDAAATDGETFTASVMHMREDIVATRQSDGGWSFSREPADADFLAVRYDRGFGWDPDNILGGDHLGDALRDWFADEFNASWLGDVEYVAVGVTTATVVTYHAGPPARCTSEQVQ